MVTGRSGRVECFVQRRNTAVALCPFLGVNGNDQVIAGGARSSIRGGISLLLENDNDFLRNPRWTIFAEQGLQQTLGLLWSRQSRQELHDAVAGTSGSGELRIRIVISQPTADLPFHLVHRSEAKHSILGFRRSRCLLHECHERLPSRPLRDPVIRLEMNHSLRPIRHTNHTLRQ